MAKMRSTKTSTPADEAGARSRAKGCKDCETQIRMGKNIATATKYAQDDLKQTAKSLKGKVTQASTNCGPVADGYKCKISAVVCPK